MGIYMHAKTRKERDREIRRLDFLNAAERVFAAKGFHDTTMADIAREVQYAVGTIYLYFRNKEILYINLLEKKIGELFETVINAAKKETKPLKKIETLVKRHMAYIQDNREFFHILLSERGGIRGGIKDVIRNKVMNRFFKYASYISGLVSECIKDGKFRKELNPQYTAFFLVGMMNATAFPQLRKEKISVDFRRLSEIILDVFFNGVKT